MSDAKNMQYYCHSHEVLTYTNTNTMAPRTTAAILSREVFADQEYHQKYSTWKRKFMTFVDEYWVGIACMTSDKKPR